MKRLFSFLLSIIIALSFSTSVMAGEDLALSISKDNISHKASDTLYGLSLNDSANDGGIVSNMVQNGSFESVTEYNCIGWKLNNIVSMSANDSVSANNKNHAVIHVQNKGVIENNGFDDSMHFEKGITYEFSCMVQNVDFDGTIGVYLNSKGNSDRIVQISDGSISSSQWTTIKTNIKADETSAGSLAIVFDGNGEIGIDMVSLVPTNSYGYDSDKWSYVSLRSDIVDAIKNVNPSFIRFVGGCTVESLEFSWKNTIGPLDSRYQLVDADESVKTCAMGYHEYFQLCEDLNAIAVPVVGAGVICQHNGEYDMYVDAYNRLNMSDDEWRAYLSNERGMDNGRINAYAGEIDNLGVKSKADFDKYIASSSIKPGTTEFTNYVQDILDLIEYANGDSITSYWGALRAMNGHEQPFGLKYLAIGNDNFGEAYERNFAAISKKVKDKYPNIVLISSTKSSGTLIDEHYSISDDMMVENNTIFDSFDRDSKGIVVGEYSADKLGDMASAVNEAGFMCGAESNSDAVKMLGYSPALAFGEGAMLNFTNSDVILTPSYYNQMIFANNVGTKIINTSLASEDVYQSVTVDENAQVLYVKLVNSSSSSKSVRVSLDGFNDINLVSNISLGNKFSDAYNSAKKQTVAPEINEIECEPNGFTISLGGNSVNVVRVAYGENDGTALWQIPDSIDTSTKVFVPKSVKVLLVVFVPAFVIGSVLGYLIYTKLIKRKGNSDNV